MLVKLTYLPHCEYAKRRGATRFFHFLQKDYLEHPILERNRRTKTQSIHSSFTAPHGLHNLVHLIRNIII